MLKVYSEDIANYTGDWTKNKLITTEGVATKCRKTQSKRRQVKIACLQNNEDWKT